MKKKQLWTPKTLAAHEKFFDTIVIIIIIFYERYEYANDAKRAVNRGQSSEFQNGEPQQG